MLSVSSPEASMMVIPYSAMAVIILNRNLQYEHWV